MKGISQLVDMVYASAADPQKYDALMDVWARHIDAALTSVDPAIDGHVTDAAEIERHFNRAFTILERLGRQAAEAMMRIWRRSAWLSKEKPGPRFLWRRADA